MILWKFYTYVSPTGRNDVQAEINRYDVASKLSLERALRHLAITPIAEWNEPQAKKLKNEDPLYEIRYKADRRATRALGFFYEQAFIVTLICYHKGTVYTPKDAFESARRRVGHLKDENGATAVALEIDGEVIS